MPYALQAPVPLADVACPARRDKVACVTGAVRVAVVELEYRTVSNTQPAIHATEAVTLKDGKTL
jgi:hypothetical protein